MNSSLVFNAQEDIVFKQRQKMSSSLTTNNANGEKEKNKEQWVYVLLSQCSVDLVVSCLGLHWTNLPGAMIQSRLALKPDGLFLAAILGGETLKELKIACTLAQMEREGGISPRVSITFGTGMLLQKAGFTLPALELIKHFRAMGETNALSQMNNILKRDTALATAAIYDSMFSAEDGTVPATFQMIGRIEGVNIVGTWDPSSNYDAFTFFYLKRKKLCQCVKCISRI
ncbi:putative methyltransferase, mitochondrial [Glycine max]|uniref:Methyltransferase type 11 domain-containing protein n=1 Tax=Glycine max TaxID=3847 RepID=A0A0R0KCR2_SOYBN|nr:putative methyltransferase, mitochondrial [Glycine max]